jgi:hypothetical protein
MANPTTREEFKDYCLRQLGAPVLEINLDDDQIDDRIDEAIQFYQEYHFDGIEKMYLKHRVTADDAERFKKADFISTKDGDDGGVTFTISSNGSGYTDGELTLETSGSATGTGLQVDVKVSSGVLTEVLISNQGSGYKVGDVLTIVEGANTTGTITINSVDSDSRWQNRGNYLTIPDHIVGINKVFGVSSSLSSNEMWGFANQYFLMDVFSFTSGYTFGHFDMSYYYMIKQYFETIDMVVNAGSLIQYRFNKRQDRLYIDVDTERIDEGDYLVIECYRALDPADWSKVYNDSFLKRYASALLKRQWGQNMIKYNNIQLPGGVTMNGRQLWEDGDTEAKMLESKMISDYMLPPLDMIG